MQQLWSDIDCFIEKHLTPQDPALSYAIENTEQQGFPEHLAVAPNQGMLLQMLIQMNACKRILEVGTFAAYSTMWLARALPEDGYVLTIEAREKHANLAQQHIDFAKKEGFKKITIQVMGSNPAALKLYNKLGFVEEGRLKKEFFIDGEYIDDCILAFYLDKSLM